MGKGLLNQGFFYPTCLSNGPHRYSAPHSIGKDRKRWLTKCRVCSESMVSWFDEEKGVIVEKIFKSSTRSTGDAMVDK